MRNKMQIVLLDAKVRTEHRRNNKHKDQYKLFRMSNFAQPKEGQKPLLLSGKVFRWVE